MLITALLGSALGYRSSVHIFRIPSTESLSPIFECRRASRSFVSIARLTNFSTRSPTI
jgi:hypothetical protein